MVILQENSCLDWAVEFVGETTKNLSVRESGCIGVYMITNNITCEPKHLKKGKGSHGNSIYSKAFAIKTVSFLAFFNVNLSLYNF